MRPASFAAALAALSLLLGGPRAEAQTRPAFFDQPSEIRQVGTMEPGQRYPIVIMLPPTNGTSHRSFDQYRSAIPFDAYYVMLTPGQPQTSDYLPRFYNYVTWADERVGEDLERARARHAVDADRVYLAGFSLGGDTSWALLLRHPERYRGAVVMGSRSSARPRGNALAVMRARDVRVAFLMGEQDQDVRRRGIQRAYERARSGSIPAELYRFPGGHVSPPYALLVAAMRFVMTPAVSPPEPRPVAAP